MEVSDLPSTDTLRPDATLLQLASSAAIFGVRTVTAWAGAYLPGSPRLSIFCVCARVSSSSPPPLPLLGFVLYYLSDFSPSYWAPFMRVLPSDRTVSKNLPISRVSIIASWLSNPATSHSKSDYSCEPTTVFASLPVRRQSSWPPSRSSHSLVVLVIKTVNLAEGGTCAFSCSTFLQHDETRVSLRAFTSTFYRRRRTAQWLPSSCSPLALRPWRKHGCSPPWVLFVFREDRVLHCFGSFLASWRSCFSTKIFVAH